MKGIELMSPAGSFESLAAALQAEANAVYFGVEQLNMRARSSNNFTVADIPTVVHSCHAKGIKAYVTLNTIVYDYDLQLMKKLIRSSHEYNVDGVIASDYAVLQEAKAVGVPVHLSTQANVTNIETVSFLAPFVDVVVLARELSLTQVKQVVREIERRNITGPSGELIRIEVFAHGALCMAVSGKCYMSLHSHYASANRGACVQNCRREYEVKDKEEGFTYTIDNEYIMSAKDLCTIDFLDQVIGAGVDVLKIEGRGRAPEYVYTTTRCYKEAIKSIADGTYSEERIAAWKSALEKVYNRGFWDGYYLGRKLGEWTDQHGSSATEKKVFIGKGSRYFPKIQVGEFLVEAGIVRKGDEVMIVSSSSGVNRYTLDSLIVNGSSQEVATKGDRITFTVPMKVLAEDKLYKLLSN